MVAEWDEQVTDVRRRVPPVGGVLDDPRLALALDRLGRDVVKAVVTATLQRVRAGELTPEAGAVIEAVLDGLPQAATSLRRVINATGVLLHTNLGRAALSGAARDALALAAGTVDVEYDPVTGGRARRGRGTLAALSDLVPEAEAVHVVGNNAAALALIATALAPDAEIVLSRGEMVEIGDGFRIPDLLVGTGSRLREVGTTNRTSAADYAAAIVPDTGFLLKVHRSNFVQHGFVGEADVAELAGLPGRTVPVVADTGSGLLRPEPLLPAEPDVASTLAAGADLVTASGDKLLGGPQAGLIFGRADLVETVRRHPLARAFRVDKLTLAALEATVRGPMPPVLAALRAELPALRERAAAILTAIDAPTARAELAIEIVESEATVGGGAAPGVTFPSVALALPSSLAEPLRLGGPLRPPVIGRVVDGRLLLDLRGIDPADDDALAAAVTETIESTGRSCM